jgi:hypothetical protein
MLSLAESAGSCDRIDRLRHLVDRRAGVHDPLDGPVIRGTE